MFSYGGQQREHTESCVCMAVRDCVCMCPYPLKWAASYENSHKGVLYYVGQNNQCLSNEINIIVTQCSFSISLCWNRSLWDALVPASFLNFSA